MPSENGFSGRGGVETLDPLDLVRRCAEDTGDAEHWGEFMRRFGPKIKCFVRATLGQFSPGAALGEADEADFFQSTILKLVAQKCAALKRFSGSSVDEFLAFLAVVARSAVRDCLRRQRARKRSTDGGCAEFAPDVFREASSGASEPGAEHECLVGELERLSSRIMRSQPPRDQLIFDLYFTHDLPASQIAACKGIGLTKRGVEHALGRLITRVRSAVARPTPVAD